MTDETKETKETKEVKIEVGGEAPVVEKPKRTLEVKNPYLTVRVEIHGLEPKQWVGNRVSVGKSARAWIRARSLSVDTAKVPGVQKIETAGIGEAYIDTDGTEFDTDLLIYRFTAEAIEESKLTVNVPRPKKPKKEAPPPVEDANDVDDVAVEEAVPEAW